MPVPFPSPHLLPRAPVLLQRRCQLRLEQHQGVVDLRSRRFNEWDATPRCLTGPAPRCTRPRLALASRSASASPPRSCSEEMLRARSATAPPSDSIFSTPSRATRTSTSLSCRRPPANASPSCASRSRAPDSSPGRIAPSRNPTASSSAANAAAEDARRSAPRRRCDSERSMTPPAAASGAGGGGDTAAHSSSTARAHSGDDPATAASRASCGNPARCAQPSAAVSAAATTRDASPALRAHASARSASSSSSTSASVTPRAHGGPRSGALGPDVWGAACRPG